MTSIHQIERKVCEKRENNQRQSTRGKVLTIPLILWKSITNPAPIRPLPPNTFLPLIAMSKVTTIATNPPVDVKLWEKGRRYFWAYNYPNCSKYGPFKSEKLALLDATNYSTN